MSWQLQPEALEAAAAAVKHPLTLRKVPGDHRQYIRMILHVYIRVTLCVVCA
jgi:hypothetical protein